MSEIEEQFRLLNSTDEAVVNPITAREGIVAKRNPLSIDLDDKEFIKRANKLIKDSKDFFDHKSYDLTNRRKMNEDLIFGRGLAQQKLKEYNARYDDNIIYEAMSYIKPMALSRLPEIVVTPGNDQEQSKQTATLLSKMINTDLGSRDRKRVLGLAYAHRPVYFTGVIKAYWNPEKGKYGDYDFKVIHPELLVVDQTCQTNNPADMDFIAENVEWTVKEWVMRFPKKEQDFYDELKKDNVFTDKKNQDTEEGMNTKVKGWEIWFKHYEKKDDGYTMLWCVGWFYKKCCLDKIKHPYWDWDGDTVIFKYDKKVDEQALASSIASQDFNGMTEEKTFHNHMESPEPPYILMGYDQWGKTPLDETSNIEQSRRLQENLNKRGRQTTEMLDRARGKHIFSGESGLKKDDVEAMDMNNPEQDIFVKGKVNEVHAFIQGEQPSPSMIQDKNEMRERIFDKMGVHGPARGAVDTNTAATNNQMAREGDFSRSDDVTDDTINYAAEKMSNWILQFIKLFYTENHFKKTLGTDGSFVFQSINRDMVEDGMIVSISASGTDKLKAEQRAMDMAKLKYIDPLTFYTDMNMSDPKGRTEKLMMFMTQPELYIQTFVKGNGTAKGMAQELNGGGQPQDGQVVPQGGSPQALMDIAQIQQGTVPPVPDMIDPQYIQTFTAFMNDPNGAEAAMQQFPQIKEQLLMFAKQVAEKAVNSPQQQQPPAQGTPPSTMTPPMGAPSNASVGPMTGNPTPGNTSQIAIAPR